MNQETKKNLPSNGRLGDLKKGELLVKTAKDIIGNSSDPVKLIGDLIQYQRVAIKFQVGKSGGK